MRCCFDRWSLRPWIADGLRNRHTDEDLVQRRRRAAAMRLHRLNTGRGGFDDLVELIRHLAAYRDYDQAVSVAFQACGLLGGEVAISALLAESVPLIPTDHPGTWP